MPNFNGTQAKTAANGTDPQDLVTVSQLATAVAGFIPAGGHAAFSSPVNATSSPGVWTDAVAGVDTVQCRTGSGGIAYSTISTNQIGNSQVTLAKLANLASQRLLGNDTGSTSPTALTVTGGVEFTGTGGIQRSALTGDVTASAGSNATTLAASGVTANSYGDASHSVTVAFDAKGRATSATSVAIAIDTSALTSGTLAAARFPALTGDVTNSAGSLTTTISAGVVTLAKMANLASQRLLGNDTGSGAPVALTVASGIAFSGSGGIVNTLITGKAGGQTILGGTANGDPLSIASTSAGTLGPITLTASQINLTAAGNAHVLNGTQFTLANGSATGGLVIGAGSDAAFLAEYTSGTMNRVRILSAAGLVEQQNSTNPQTFNVYNTFTSTTNYERATLGWVSNVFTVQTGHGSSGTGRSLAIGTNNSNWLTMDNVGASHFTGASVQIDNVLGMNGTISAGEVLYMQGTATADRVHFFMGGGPTIPNGFGVHSYVTWDNFGGTVAAGGTVTQLNHLRILPVTYTGTSSSILTDPVASTLHIAGAPSFVGSWSVATSTLNAAAVGLRVDAAASISGAVSVGGAIGVTGNGNVGGNLVVSGNGTVDGSMTIGPVGDLVVSKVSSDMVIQMTNAGDIIIEGQAGNLVRVTDSGGTETFHTSGTGILTLGPNGSVANGTGTVSFGSTAPAGANPTPRRWLKIADGSGSLLLAGF